MPSTGPNPKTDWQPTLATILSCKRTWDTWFVDETAPSETGSYELASYLVRFSYQVGTNHYAGKFVAGSPQSPGDSFQITYNPAHPEEHTGSDPKRGLLFYLLAWSAGLTIAGLLIHFFPDAWN